MGITKDKKLNNGKSSIREVLHPRNEGIPFDLDLFKDIHVNKSAVERRTATMGKRRSVKKEWQAAWLLRAITCIDLTTLAGDDTAGNVIRLCNKAKNPVRKDLLDAFYLLGKVPDIHLFAVSISSPSEVSTELTPEIERLIPELSDRVVFLDPSHSVCDSRGLDSHSFSS